MKDLLGREIPEKEIQDQIIDSIKPFCHVYNTTTGVFKVGQGKKARWIKTFPKGTPDLIGFRKRDGKMFFIEVKNGRGRLSPEQKEFLSWAENYPILVGVARCVNDALKIIGVEP